MDRLLGEHGLQQDSPAARQEFERRMEARPLEPGDEESFKALLGFQPLEVHHQQQQRCVRLTRSPPLRDQLRPRRFTGDQHACLSDFRPNRHAPGLESPTSIVCVAPGGDR